MSQAERAILWSIVIYLLFFQKPNIEELSNELEIADVCHDVVIGYIEEKNILDNIEEIRTIVGEEYQGKWYKQGLIGAEIEAEIEAQILTHESYQHQ